MYGPEYLGNLIHRELGQQFVAHGDTFDVFALASAREMQDRAADAVEDGIHVHRAIAAGPAHANALNALAKPLFHYDRFGAGLAALKRYLSAQAPYDVVMAEGAYPFGALCVLAGTPGRLAITVAGGDFINSRETAYGYGRFRTARALMRRAFEQAAIIRVTTPLVRARVLELGAPPERIALVPRNIGSYCYPPPGVSPVEFRAAMRHDLPYAVGGAHVIAAVGRLLPIKGFDTLIRALPAVVQGAGDTRLLLVGPNRVDPVQGDYQAYLTRLAAECGVADKLIFTGAIPHPDMRRILAACDLIAVPSVLEGMNKVAVEGAAVGTPSVVTRTAGIADLLSAANAGAVVEPGSPEALAQGIVRVLCDADVRRTYAANGIRFAAQFTPEIVGKQLIALFESH